MLPIQTFDFEDQPVRTLMRDDEPWFVGADVCRVLGLENVSMALQRLDADEKGVSIVDPLSKPARGGGPQQAIIVSEPGVYRLVFTSRTEAAERFKRWLAHVVLPELRRTGRFVMGEDDPDLPVAADGKVFGLRLAKVNAAARMIAVADRVYGPEAARRLWESDRSLPPLRDFEVARLSDTALDDPRGCLRHLLAAATPRGTALREVLSLALRDKAAAKSLRELGLAIGPSGFPGHVAIATRHGWLADVFAQTQWADDWRLALGMLPGALAAAREFSFGKATSRAVLIPRAVLLDAIHPKGAQ